MLRSSWKIFWVNSSIFDSFFSHLSSNKNRMNLQRSLIVEAAAVISISWKDWNEHLWRSWEWIWKFEIEHIDNVIVLVLWTVSQKKVLYFLFSKLVSNVRFSTQAFMLDISHERKIISTRIYLFDVTLSELPTCCHRIDAWEDEWKIPKIKKNVFFEK